MEPTLRQLQRTQLEILDQIDRICKKHHIPYSLYAGTLLGAVRHQGFIPWDDDLDVMMMREDYDRFIRLWPNEQIEGYILQNKENTPAFPQSFTKIRKDHTTFLQNEWERGRYHTGIFVDIFPVDRIPNGRWRRWRFYWNCICYQLFTREFVPPKASLLVRLGSRVLLGLVPPSRREGIRRRCLNHVTAYGADDSLCTVLIETVETMRITYSPDLLMDTVDLPFEHGCYSCVCEWNEMLKEKYGDYMQLPPAHQRTWTHHPIILDFEHNYGELEN